MKIAYCTNVRLPSERAHGHQVAHVCSALSALGHTVHVFSPFRKNVISKSFNSYYNISDNIKISHLGTFDPIDHPLIPRVFQLPILNTLFTSELQKKLQETSYDLLYTRSPALLGAMLQSGIPTVLELHQIPRRNRTQFVRHCNQCRLVACLTTPMKEELLKMGVEEKRLSVEGDAVDVKAYEKLPSITDARTHFKLKTDRPIVGYIGRLKTLGMEKGVKYLLEAIAELQSSHTPIFAFIVGGPAADQKEYEQVATNVGLTEKDIFFTGSVPAADVPAALTACDILAMPFPDLPHYRQNMSPLKMFEYMAAGKPIITSDLPTIRDVLSEETAYFCEPGSTASLTLAIQEVLKDSKKAEQIAHASKELSKHYSWEERMQRIVKDATLRA